MKPHQRSLIARFRSFLPLLALVAVLPLLLRSDSAEAHIIFNPTQTVVLVDSSPGANSDIKGSLDLPIGDLNFGGLISFTPAEFTVPAAGDLPIGALVARLETQATLGLVNGACASVLPVNFDFVNASVDINDTIDPLPPGTENALSPLAADSDFNGIQDGADRYPSYLNELFENQTPRARYFGETLVAQTAVILNFIIFEPGTSPAPDLVPAIDASLGYPNVTVLQDPVAQAFPSPITDFCTPLIANTTVFGLSKDNPNTGAIESGFVVRQNPASAGTFNFDFWSRSLRDADDDHLENSLDTCPFVTNVEDPRKPPPEGDPDLDGIDSACDEDDSGLCGPGAGDDLIGSDCDGDGFANRGDNCPLVSNDDQADEDDDFIGDVCDTEGNGPNVADGDNVDVCLATQISVGGGGPVPTGAVTLGNTTCPPASAAGGEGTPTDVLPTEEEQQQIAKEKLLESLTVGLNISAGLDTVPVGGSTPVVAVCAEEQDGLEPLAGVDITFKIDPPPGSDADLDGQAEVTVTSDAEGFAEATLNVGSTLGDLVVSASGIDCGPAATTTVTVTGASALGETSGPSGAAGGAATGIGSLAPTVASIPAWAAIASGLGGAGLLGSLGAIASRILRRRRQ